MDSFENIKIPRLPWKAISLTILIFGAVISSYIGIKRVYEIAAENTAKAKVAQEQEYQNRVVAMENEVSTKGTDAFSFVELAQQYLKSGDGERAIAAAQIATQKDPLWSDGFVNLGQVYLATNQFEQAKTALEQALKTNPLNGQAHYFMSLTYQELNDSSASKIELAKAQQFGYDTQIGG